MKLQTKPACYLHLYTSDCFIVPSVKDPQKDILTLVAYHTLSVQKDSEWLKLRSSKSCYNSILATHTQSVCTGTLKYSIGVLEDEGEGVLPFLPSPSPLPSSFNLPLPMEFP